MGRFSGKHRRSGGVLSLLLVPCMLASLGQLGETQALYADRVESISSIGVVSAAAPVVTPVMIDLVLYVGDRAEKCDVAGVSNPSGWSMQVSISATGWLADNNVAIGVEPLSPNRTNWPDGRTVTLGPYQQARVYFTKAAVQKPTQINGKVHVAFAPGSQSSAPITGEVINPANAARPRTVPADCVKTTLMALQFDGPEPVQEEQAQDPIVEPPTVESTTGEVPLAEPETAELEGQEGD